MDDFANTPWVWMAPILVAPIIGSFLGVLIQRLPEGRPVVLSRSACDRCGHRLAARDLIPLLSFALSGGRCRYCGAAIGAFPLAVEAAAAGVAVWAVAAVASDEVWVTCLLGWSLLTLGWIDARTMVLPDVLTLPLLAAGLAVTGFGDLESLPEHAIAAALGYFSLSAVAWAYRQARGRDGLGMGDAKLLAAIGAWLGLSLLPVTVFLAACLGLVAAGGAILAGKRMTAATAIPFGPFLALAGWVCWLYAGALEEWMAG